MYKKTDVRKIGTTYHLPGNIDLINCISVTEILKIAGINSTKYTPGTGVYNQAKIGTLAHKYLESGEFNVNSVNNLHFMQAKTNLDMYTIENTEIFCWQYIPIGEYTIVGIADCLATKNVKELLSFALIDWKSTGQDDGMGVDTVIRALLQLSLYKEMIRQSYRLPIAEIVVYELHKTRDLIVHKATSAESFELAKFLLDCIVSRKKFHEIAGQSELVLELRQRVQRSKNA